MMRSFLILFNLLLCLLLRTGYGQTVIRVGQDDSPIKTIQDGVNQANPQEGDILSVYPGIYYEQLAISKPLTIRVDGPGTVTIGPMNFFKPPFVNVNIQTIFEAVNPKGAAKFSIIRPDYISLPDRSGLSNHQQGIQKTTRGEFVVSGSGKDTGYIYFTDSDGNIINVISPSYGDFNHAGGIQVVDDILVVGYERFENKAGGTSKILFYDIRDVRNPQPLTHLTISRDEENSTAGAVALCPYKKDGLYQNVWLLLVANWDSERLDFYLSNTNDLRNPTARFPAIPDGSWSKKANGLGPGSIDENWEPYQNINMFSQAYPATYWFIGMHTTKLPWHPSRDDWADLYILSYNGNNSIVTKISKKHFYRSGSGPRFEYGSGFYYNVSTNRFEVYACEGNLSDGDVKNRCNKWE